MQPIIIICLLWIIWTLTWMAVAIAGDPGPHKLHGPLLFLYRLVILGSVFLLFTVTPWPGFDVQYRFWDRAPSEEIGWALTAIVLIAFAVAWWATILRLIAHKRGNIVVETGPFKYTRQPFYLALIIAALATTVMFGRPSSFTGAAVMCIAFLVKILIDEHAIHEKTPAYAEYAARVSLLLPIPRRHPREPVAAHASIAFARAAAPPKAEVPIMAAAGRDTIAPVPEAPKLEVTIEAAMAPKPDKPVVETVAAEVESQAMPAVTEKPKVQATTEPAAREPSIVTKAAQLHLSLDEAEQDELQAAAGLSEAKS